MSTQPAPRRDPLPLVAAILAGVGTGLLVTGIWTTVYSRDGGGSATPYGLRDSDAFGSLVVNSWILLLIAGGLGVLAIAPFVVALVRRGTSRPVLGIGLVVLLGAVALGTIITIAFISDRDALGFDLSLSVAFYLVLGGVIAWVLSVILTAIALISPARPPAVTGDDRSPAPSSAWPAAAHREPLLSSPPPPPPPSPRQIASPYPTASERATRRVTADDGATRVLPAADAPRCPSCGVSVDPGARFCSGCGAEQPPPVPTCTSCGTVANAGDRFCRRCGGQVHTRA